MTTDALELEWRPLREEDRNYILSSWLRSYADSAEFRSVPRQVYFALYEPIVKRLLERSTIAVAFTRELPDTVIGYLVVEGENVIHFVHTKRRFRRCGVARWMLRGMTDLPAIFTHSPTAIAARLCGPSWVHEPMRRFDSNRKAAA